MTAILVHYKPTFVRQLKKLESSLQNEAIEKIEMFRNTHNHELLSVHKLHGRMKGLEGFSVNFKYRIMFQYLSKTEVVLLAIGDHEVYR